MREEICREVLAHQLRLRVRAAEFCAEDPRAVGHAAHADEPEAAVGAIDRVRGERRLAAAAHLREERALGGHRGSGGGVVNRGGGELTHEHVTAAGLDPEHALRDRRDAELERQQLRDPIGHAEAREAGGGEHHGVELAGVELRDARGNIAAQHLDLEIGTQREQLALPAHARRADACALRQRVDGDRRACAQGIPRGLARRDRRDRKSVGELGGHVLHAVHREVGRTVDERLLDLLDEQTLAADLRERHVDDRVA